MAIEEFGLVVVDHLPYCPSGQSNGSSGSRGGGGRSRDVGQMTLMLAKSLWVMQIFTTASAVSVNSSALLSL